MSVTLQRAQATLPRRPLTQPDAHRAAAALPKPAGPLTYLAASGANVWPAALSRTAWSRWIRGLVRRPARP